GRLPKGSVGLGDHATYGLQMIEIRHVAVDDRRREISRVHVVARKRGRSVQHVVGGEEDLQLHVAGQLAHPGDLKIQVGQKVVAGGGARRQEEVLWERLVDLIDAKDVARRTRL